MDPDIRLYHLVTGLEINTRDEIRCKNSADQDAYIQTVSDRLADEGFLLSRVCKGPDNILKTKMNPKWWSVKQKIFSQNDETGLQCSCYHDH